MTIKDVVQEALLLCGLPEIPDAYAILYTNMAQSKLASKYNEACTKKIVTINASKEDWYKLENDFKAVKRVSLNDNYFSDYIIENGSIYLPKGDFRLEMIAYPARLTSINDTLTIATQFQPTISYFISSYERARIFSDVEADKDRLYQIFMQNAKEINDALTSSKNSKRRIKAYKFM